MRENEWIAMYYRTHLISFSVTGLSEIKFQELEKMKCLDGKSCI